MDLLFSFLFKYRPLLFAEGEVVFRTSGSVVFLLLLAVAGAAVAVATYARPRGKAEPSDRVLMALLRLGAFAVLLFALLRPTLVNDSTVPQRNFVGVLLDDSRSMTLPGADGEARSAFIKEQLDPENGDLLRELEERFAVRYFRYSSSTNRVELASDLTYDGTRTDLVGALDRAREELSGVPLSGLVVISDGADNSGRALAEAMVPLQAASVPVYTVGLGEESLTPDIQVGRVSAPRTVLRGTSLLLDVVITQRGFAGQTLPLVVEDDERILTEDEVRFGEDGEPTVARVRFTLDQAGSRRIRLRVPVQEGEKVSENNERGLEVEVREAREKILYFEGEPRFEVKFLRRALADDENIQVVVLQRTAEDKFLRLDVDDGDELAGGFPKTREELFKYRGLILGSVEASYFTHDQLAMIAEFVSRRGGGFLMLGGRWSFAEGGYGGTPVAEALPVVMREPALDPQAAFSQVKVRPTVAGLGHVATQIRPDGRAGPELWDSLPALSIMNHIQEVKPGATTLLSGEGPGGTRVVLAYQRYGRGKSVAFPVLDSWIWQFHADIPVEDQTHETFWQQLLRWLVDGVPDYLSVSTEKETVEVGEAVRIVTEVNDSTYVEVNDAFVEAIVTAPSGAVQVVPLDWTVERDGEYAGAFNPTMEGDYEIAVRATRSGDLVIGADEVHLRVGPGTEEFFDAGLRRSLLERLADETGGKYYDPATVDRLPEDIRFTGGGVTLTEERDLWDMPILFFLLVAFVGGEWVFRRRRGLV
ncbi:MAG: hypothetical protein MUO50_02800 [Longimicrobiales bacterium]|nr:hypothetical protein [Longimicrobiales bacterium]